MSLEGVLENIVEDTARCVERLLSGGEGVAPGPVILEVGDAVERLVRELEAVGVPREEARRAAVVGVLKSVFQAVRRGLERAGLRDCNIFAVQRGGSEVPNVVASCRTPRGEGITLEFVMSLERGMLVSEALTARRGVYIEPL